MKTEHLIIIGSGPAALTAAVYAGRAMLSPLILEGKNPGGQLMGTTYVENWPGVPSIMGPELMMRMREHAEQYTSRFVYEEVVSSDFSTTPYTVTTDKGNTYQAQSIIIATGSTPKRLGIPGESEHWGKGVTTCAVCDGAFYRDKKVIIVGGGDTAMEDASFMTNFTKDITIVHIHDKLTASVSMQKRVINNPAIKIIYNSTLTRIEGTDAHVTGATITNQKTQESTSVAVDGIFVAIGLTPNSQPFRGQLALNPYGYIVTTDHTQTSIPGIFAAGDVVDYRYRQAITSAGTGCMAALDAERYLKDQGL